MTSALVVPVLAVSGALGLWALVDAARGLAPRRTLLQALFALQALLIAQLAYVLYRVSGGARPAETGAFTGYVVLTLLLLPGGLALSADERSRYGTLVLAVACLTVAVVELRMRATWS